MNKKPLSQLYAVQTLFLIPSVLYWLSDLDWSLSGVGLYSIFPLLGLLAFTLMWFHLMVAYLKKIKPDGYDYGTFYRKTSNLVLVLIILHPALLIYKSIDAGTNFLDFSGSDNRVFIIFGIIALIIFGLYEFVDKAKNTTFVKNNQPYIAAINRAGFVLVFVHGLMIGQNLQSGPLRILWLFYGVTAALYIIWVYQREIRQR